MSKKEQIISVPSNTPSNSEPKLEMKDYLSFLGISILVYGFIGIVWYIYEKEAKKYKFDKDFNYLRYTNEKVAFFISEILNAAYNENSYKDLTNSDRSRTHFAMFNINNSICDYGFIAIDDTFIKNRREALVGKELKESFKALENQLNSGLDFARIDLITDHNGNCNYVLYGIIDRRSEIPRLCLFIKQNNYANAITALNYTKWLNDNTRTWIINYGE